MPNAAKNPPATGQNGKTASFTVLAQSLSRRLPTAVDPPSVETLLAELKPQLNGIMTFAGPVKGKTQKNELDVRGTELWNRCTTLRREDMPGMPPTRSRLLLRSRTFAFFMIDAARSERSPKLPDVVHLMKLALKAGKWCIDDGSLKLASAVFVKASNYSSALAQLQQTMLGPDDLTECKRLETEYYILRTALCWKEDNLNVADFMYGKAQPILESLDRISAEKMAEVLFEIGRDLSKKGDLTQAVRWLERAHDVISTQDLDRLSRDAVELRLSISQAHIHALLGMDTPEASQKALDLVNYIESEVGEKAVVLLLRLELLQKTPAEAFDIEAYADVLRRMVRCFNFSEAHFRLLLHHSRKLHDKSPSFAAGVVNGMLGGTIVTAGRDEWVERLVLFRIWMETSQRDSMAAVEALAKVLTGVQENLTKPFDASAAVGALTLMWKKIEVNYSQACFDIADGWCRLALQPVFENGGPANRSRLGRKLILCALGQNNIERARQAFHEMSEAAQDEPMTRYLMYKAAIRSSDHDLAAECLQLVGSTAGQDPNFLYACLLEAQKTNNVACAMQAIKQLAERNEFNETSPIHLPAFLRCNIRLAVSLMEAAKGTDERRAAVEEVLGMFEGASEAVQRDPRDQDGNRLFIVKELDWFCQNAYNLGVKNSHVWDLSQLVRLFTCCLDIARHYPADLPSEAASDISFRMMFCNFVLAAALVSLARTEENVERQLQHYLAVRKHVEAYNTALQRQVKGIVADQRVSSDLTAKLATLLVFDFEAAVALKKYDALGYIIRTVKTTRDVNALKAMGDIVLRGKLSGHGEMRPSLLSDVLDFLVMFGLLMTTDMFSTLGVIVNEIWELEHMKGDKLAKYVRCMFQAVRPLDAGLGQRLMRQAIGMARDSSKTSHPFPPEELEWLVTTSFNHAVDAYNARQDDECNSWADLAMNLAHYAGDDGALEKTLQENRMKLRFDL
ncbi:hypothetical protein CSOJ01_09425 [Colletotrichum sojae]|uniref:Protein ZIP4 homolog n=1 Tax=Colletotrichum sojae TaxID=2175907 RepID=A0A8H6J3S0_9PEZI|nr:hypothetical protein CSOJ01_09425 [Colletotrichum sojae]